MKRVALFFHRLQGRHLSAAALILLLQRTPVLRVASAAGEAFAASPLGALLRPALGTLASLGAVHTLAGATEIVFSRTPPINGTVGTAITPLLFTVTGTPGDPPASFQVTGLPPGLVLLGINGNGVLNASSGAITGTPTTAGTFQASVQAWRSTNAQGDTIGPVPLVFTITGSANVAPAITIQPGDQSVVAGALVIFSSGASGSPSPTFQWRRNDTAISGATSASFTIASAQTADAGDYTVVATNAAGSATSNIARLTVTPPLPPPIDPAARLSNLSVRTTLAVGQLLSFGVVVRDGARQVLVRAAGPALAGFGLPGAMADPRLELFEGSTSVFLNDNWPAVLAPTFLSVGAFPFANGSLDAAFLRDISGPVSVQTRGTGAGVVLVEAYDTGPATAARMINVSALNRVGTGDDILIAGFNITGAGAKRLLIRAIGPQLAVFGLAGVLADPVLDVFNAAGVRQTGNDNWDASLAPTFTAVGAFGLTVGSRDAALVAILAPGSYTAQVRGASNGTGEALIEIYEVP
ncbi:MAG: immunoglobulin domain-containing protein [Opitutaceae bacterium]|nr:immunoglobulin domain-containing protein [Opitutaceae bacterium]